MNGKFEIKSQTNNAVYEYKDENMIVQGNFVKDSSTGELININGSCYRKNEQGNQGEFIGNFNGYMRDGQIRYNTSDMSRSDSTNVWKAIDEIDANVIGSKKESDE